ncbi:MAG: sugar phosphate isomerase/epimerase family protein [Planctomycetota bacterium]
MYKNFCPSAMGINGRQSELIELALTYAFSGMDIDMQDIVRRAQRTDFEDASKYLRAAEIKIGTFPLPVGLDDDDEAFTAQVGALHPLAEVAEKLGATRAVVHLPASTDRLPFNEFFDVQSSRLNQIGEVLGSRGIHLAVGFSPAKDLAGDKQFPFVNTVESFAALVNGVNSGHVGFLLDTFDWVVGDGAMDQISEIPADKVVAVRLSSIAEDVDTSAATSGDRMLPTAQGLIDHVKLVGHLNTIGFDGPIGPATSTAPYKGQTREFIVQTAQEAIDGISKEAGLDVKPLPSELIEDIPYEPTPI